jgi:hypothetical protein
MSSKHSRSRFVLWLARIVGGSMAAFWLTILLFGAVQETPTWSSEEIGMLILTIAVIASTIVAFIRAKLGGLLMLVSGAIFCIYSFIAAGHNKIFAMLFAGGPFILAGALFLWAGANKASEPKR